MGSQQLIYSSSLANSVGDGPWYDVGGARGSQWSIHIENWVSTVSVEVSNEIPSFPGTSTPGQTPNPNAPNLQRAAYPPYNSPATVTNYSNENHAIAATVTVTHAPAAGSAFVDRGVTFATGPQAGTNLTFLPSGPGASGTYGVNVGTGAYAFNATDVANGYAVNLTYTITTPNAGVVLPTTSGYYVPNPPSGNTGGHVLVVAKSDLDVKWVRVRNSGVGGSPPVPGGTVVAFLHIDK